MNQASTIMNHFGSLILLKRRPQDIPYSTGLLVTLFAFYCFLVSVKPYQVENIELVIAWAILLQSLFLGVLYGFLKYLMYTNRFVQTASNYLGISIVHLLVSSLFTIQQPFIYVMVIAWLLTMYIHITQHAFSTRKINAFFIFMGMHVIKLMLSLIFQPAFQPLFDEIWQTVRAVQP